MKTLKAKAEKWTRARLDMVYSGKASINEYSDIIDAFMAGYRAGKRDRKEIFCDNCELRK